MYEEELKRILNASQNNALSFFVGAGVSALSGAPTWKGLIQAISEKLGRPQKEEYSSDEYLQIPQMFYYSLGENKEDYFKYVEAQLNSTSLAPNSIHREMINLNPASFITTNYDTLLEDAAIQHCQSFKVVSCDADVPTIFGDRFILKLHGDFRNKNFVLKEEDYLNYSENFKLIETLVKSIFSTNTVVFIGYGLNDYNIKLILNWTKTLLKGSFREPIFFYTGDQILTDAEILYQQSKGLSVVEWNKLIASGDDYIDRYQSIFTALKNHSKLSLEGKSEDEAFEILYNLLQPLNRLDALRIEDVSKRLYPYIRIGNDRVIHIPHDDNLLLKKFFSINQMSEAEQENITKNTWKKYQCIFDVFRKARILEVEKDYKYRLFVAGDVPFADKKCILFDYNGMNAITKKTYMSLDDNYKKAFYLFRLRRYDKAFFLFSDVAKQAFKEKNFLLYYFAESNCISLRKLIKNANKLFRFFDLNEVDALSPNDVEIDNLFRRLPVEFRSTYENLADIHSANMLYKYSFEAFIDGQELQNAVESKTTEYGLTSSDKAINRINDYLHFLQGNGIIANVFLEYRSTVKNLMSLLVYKYSTQDKKSLNDERPTFSEQKEVYFDEIDFYCFIDCFNAKEIIALLKKYQIEKIEFQNMDLVETAVNNLLEYYKIEVKSSRKYYEIIGLERQIKTCLALLRFVSISQELVDKICGFILTQEFKEILINDKVFFLEYQLARRKMYSERTTQIVENTLISYLDKHISALKKNEKFDLLSTSSEINYWNLVHYISPPGQEYHSRKLSIRISQIIKHDLSQMYSQITRHYCGYVSKSKQKKLVTWANNLIRSSFNFDFFTMLVKCDARISNEAKAQLKAYLNKRVDSAKARNENNDIIVHPIISPYEELDQVGYWCLIKKLKTKDFKEFLGNSVLFDLFCDCKHFDLDRFEVSQLENLAPHTLDIIAKDPRVRTHVRCAIADALMDKSTSSSDSQWLQRILLTHFC